MVTTLRIAGMRSVHSARAVFTALAAVEGITTAEVRLGVAVVEHDARATGEAMREAISVAGYLVTEVVSERRLPVI
jgi:copper chaperone CopZ